MMRFFTLEELQILNYLELDSFCCAKRAKGGSLQRKPSNVLHCFGFFLFQAETSLAWIVSSLALGNGRKGGLTKNAVRWVASVTVFLEIKHKFN
jgi:hypothetical protein